MATVESSRISIVGAAGDAPLVEHPQVETTMAMTMARFLEDRGDYVHVDMSDQFTRSAKVLVSVLFLVASGSIFLAPASLALFRGGGSNKDRAAGWRAVSWGVAMVILREVIVRTGSGPHYVVRRAVPTEPAIFLFAMTICFRTALERYFPSCRRIVHQKLLRWGSHRLNAVWASFVGPALLAPVLTHDVASYLFRASEEDGEGGDTIGIDDVTFPAAADVLATFGSGLGSALTPTGNLHNVLIVICLAYDSIGWSEFARNMLLPVVTVVLCACAALLLVAGRLAGSSAANASTCSDSIDGYEGLTSSNHDLELRDVVGARETGDDSKKEDKEVSSFLSKGKQEEKDPMTVEASPEGSRETVNSAIPTVVVALAATVMVVCYGVGADVILTTVTVALSVAWIGSWWTSFASGSPSSPLLAKVDVEPILLYVGISLLTTSLTDTGVPQWLWNAMIGDGCNDYGLGGGCTYATAAIVYFSGFLFTPLDRIRLRGD